MPDSSASNRWTPKISTKHSLLPYVAGPSINMIICDDSDFDPSQLIIPIDYSPEPFTIQQEEAIPLIAQVNYTPSDPFVLKAQSTPNAQNLIEHVVIWPSHLLRASSLLF